MRSTACHHDSGAQGLQKASSSQEAQEEEVVKEEEGRRPHARLVAARKARRNASLGYGWRWPLASTRSDSVAFGYPCESTCCRTRRAPTSTASMGFLNYMEAKDCSSSLGVSWYSGVGFCAVVPKERATFESSGCHTVVAKSG